MHRAGPPLGAAARRRDAQPVDCPLPTALAAANAAFIVDRSAEDAANAHGVQTPAGGDMAPSLKIRCLAALVALTGPFGCGRRMVIFPLFAAEAATNPEAIETEPKPEDAE